MCILDTNFSHPGSRVKKIPEPGSTSALKNLSNFNPKNCFLAPGNMIRDVHPGPESWLLTHPGSKGQKVTKSRIPDPQHCLNPFCVQGWSMQCLLLRSWWAPTISHSCGGSSAGQSSGGLRKRYRTAVPLFQCCESWWLGSRPGHFWWPLKDIIKHRFLLWVISYSDYCKFNIDIE